MKNITKIIVLLFLFVTLTAMNETPKMELPQTTYCMVVVQELKSDYWVGYIDKWGYVIFEICGYTYMDKGDIICGNVRSYSFKDVYNKTRDKSMRIYIEDYDLSKQRCTQWITDHNKWK